MKFLFIMVIFSLVYSNAYAVTWTYTVTHPDNEIKTYGLPKGDSAKVKMPGSNWLCNISEDTHEKVKSTKIFRRVLTCVTQKDAVLLIPVLCHEEGSLEAGTVHLPSKPRETDMKTFVLQLKCEP